MHVRGAIFDLDGVITDTSRVHERAWRETLAPIVLSTADYVKHFDGRRREAGLSSFLRAWDADCNAAWMADIMDRKDARYRSLIESEGVKVYPDALAALRWLESAAVPRALVSASRNAELVLAKAGLASMFSIVLPGFANKGNAFQAAAAQLGVPIADCAIYEDSPHAVAMAIETGAKYAIYLRRDR